MYLSLLDFEKKQLFLELETYMAKIDGEFTDDEKTVIDIHCNEMKIDNNDYICKLDLDTAIDEIKTKFSVKEKKIIFLELEFIVLADGVYTDSEKELISKLSSILDIKKSDIDEALDIAEKLKMEYERCAAFVSTN